jgi:hypothetical protein
MKKAFLLFLLMASSVFAQDQAATARSAAGCGPSQEMFDVKVDLTQHPVAKPEEGKALVYVFEDHGTGPTMRVGLDGVWVGATSNKSYFFLSMSPSEHNLCVEWQSGTFKKSSERIGAAKTLTVEAGKVYFVRMLFKETSNNWGTIDLQLEDSAEGQFLIASSALSTFKRKK